MIDRMERGFAGPVSAYETSSRSFFSRAGKIISPGGDRARVDRIKARSQSAPRRLFPRRASIILRDRVVPRRRYTDYVTAIRRVSKTHAHTTSRRYMSPVSPPPPTPLHGCLRCCIYIFAIAKTVLRARTHAC